MRLFSKSVKDFIHYLLSGAVVRLFPLLFLPYIARALNEAEFGVFSLYRLYIVLGTAVILLGIEQGLFRLIPASTIQDKTALTSASVYFTLFTGLLAGALYIAARTVIQPFLFEASLPYPAFWLPVLVWSSGLTSIVTTRYSAEKESRKFLLANTLRSGVFYFLFIAGLYAGYGLIAFFAACLISDLLVILTAGPQLIPALRQRPRLQDVKALLTIGLPLVGVLIVTLLLYQSDHYLIKYFLGLEATGIYNYGYKFAAVLSSFVLLTNNVWMPRLYEQGEEFLNKNLNEYSVLITIAAQGLYLFIAGVFIFFNELLIPPGFSLSFKVLVVTGAGYLFYGHSQLLDGWLILKNKSRVLFYASSFALIVNWILNLVFIPRYGLLAAAVTTTVTFVLLWAILLAYLIRTERPFDFSRLIGNFLLGMAPAGIFVFTGRWWWAAAVYAIVAFFLLRKNKLLGNLLGFIPTRNE